MQVALPLIWICVVCFAGDTAKWVFHNLVVTEEKMDLRKGLIWTCKLHETPYLGIFLHGLWHLICSLNIACSGHVSAVKARAQAWMNPVLNECDNVLVAISKDISNYRCSERCTTYSHTFEWSGLFQSKKRWNDTSPFPCSLRKTLEHFKYPSHNSKRRFLCLQSISFFWWHPGWDVSDPSMGTQRG